MQETQDKNSNWDTSINIDNNEKETSNKNNSQDELPISDCDLKYTPTATKVLKEQIDYGSPIINQELTKALEDETSVDQAEELAKHININLKKPHLHYNSIVRPSNDFNFGSWNSYNLKPNIDADPSENPLNPIQKQWWSWGSPREHHKKIIDINSKSNSKSKQGQGDIISTGLNPLNNIKSSNMIFLNLQSKTQKQPSIKQKLQDIYFQLNKPNDFSNSLPYSTKAMSNIHGGEIRSYNTIHISGRRHEDQNINAYKRINPYLSPTGKGTYSKPINIPKYLGFSGKSNKWAINKKFEGWNKMLHSKESDDVVIGDKWLSEDDFISWEDKIKQFESKKQRYKRDDCNSNCWNKAEDEKDRYRDEEIDDIVHVVDIKDLSLDYGV